MNKGPDYTTWIGVLVDFIWQIWLAQYNLVQQQPKKKNKITPLGKKIDFSRTKFPCNETKGNLA